MKIVVAMDSFKGCLRADHACEIIAKAITAVAPNIQIIIKPVADGGEGTARVMIKASNGVWIPENVTGPLPAMQVKAGFAWFDFDKTALVEMAVASGLELLTKEQMNPYTTTTFGTGQLIKASMEKNPHKIYLTVGGSATIDGGVGAATALGWKFLDKYGNDIPLGGAGLEKITKIVKPDNITMPGVEVFCDVDNPLCGQRGAAIVYGPQKGAMPQMIEQLEKNLSHLANVIKTQLGKDIKDIPGAGAAGGLAGGAIAFMNGKLVSGIEAVMKHSRLEDELKSADWVITGEGKFDCQSLYGKVVAGVSRLALKSNTRVAVLAGEVDVSREEYKKIGIEAAIGYRTSDMTLDYAIKNSKLLLAEAAKKLIKEYISI